MLRICPSRAAFMMVLGATLAHHAWSEETRTRSAPLLPAYRQECAACHVPYPPGMLPADSWVRVIGNLQRHYGTDASLGAATAKELSTWLTANAATHRRELQEPPQDRITRSVWFARRHGEVPASAWKLPAVKSPSNCAACHNQAEQGDFNEHRVRIPR